MYPDFETLRERSQQNLVDFLKIELELGATFAHTAKIEARAQNFEHSGRSREYAERALEAVRRFAPRIVDAEARQEIHERADELEKIVSEMWPS